MGSSEKAARLSGINVTQVRVFTYVLAGLLAGLAGIISTSRLSAAYPNAYEPVALRVISGAVIGGCSLFGGEGSVLGRCWACSSSPSFWTWSCSRVSPLRAGDRSGCRAYRGGRDGHLVEA